MVLKERVLLELNTDAEDVWGLVPPEKRSLARLKRVSIRNRSWFRELKDNERRFIDAVIIVVDKVKSLLLRRLLAPLVKRLLEATGDTQSLVAAVVGRLEYLMRMKGRVLAEQISLIARGWGNRHSSEWPGDEGFVRYLTVMEMNRG